MVKIGIFMFEVSKKPPKEGVLDKKVLGYTKYLEVLFGKSVKYKYKYTVKPFLSQNMVHFT